MSQKKKEQQQQIRVSLADEISIIQSIRNENSKLMCKKNRNKSGYFRYFKIFND